MDQGNSAGFTTGRRKHLGEKQMRILGDILSENLWRIITWIWRKGTKKLAFFNLSIENLLDVSIFLVDGDSPMNKIVKDL